MTMAYMLGTPALLAAGLCAAVMGLAIQRGATCTVAAVDQLLTAHRASRLAAMLEASLWVLGGLLLSTALQAMPRLPAHHLVSAATLLGGALLGLGAFVNRACVFGALARLGTGEWAYLMTPPGFLAGYALFHAAGWVPAATHAAAAPVLGATMSPQWRTLALALVAAAFAARLVVVARALVRRDAPASDGEAPSAWTPHSATLVIGLTFFATFALAGPWAYTDVLAELAAYLEGVPGAGSPAVVQRLLLLVALFSGALLGGRLSQRWAVVPITVARLLRCFCGGLLMGIGSAWIPGGNDGLVLMGLPLLAPHAWTAFLTMCGAIALAITARGRWPRALGWL